MPQSNRNNAKRIVRSYVQQIPAPGDAVFELLCPERETEWLDGWDYQMIHSESGYAEPGCVFSTRDGDHETIWVVAQRDPEARRIQFVRITPAVAATELVVAVEETGADGSRVHIRYTHTSLSAEGDTLLASTTTEVFNERMRFWEASMTHYLRHGTKLPLEGVERGNAQADAASSQSDSG